MPRSQEGYPNLATSLVCSGRLTDEGYNVTFNKSESVISGNGVKAYAFREKELYHLECNPIINMTLISSQQCLSTVGQWHARPGHPGKSVGKQLKDKTHEDPPESCEVWIMGKMTRSPFPRSTTVSKQPLDLIHSDICGNAADNHLQGIQKMSMFCWLVIALPLSNRPWSRQKKLPGEPPWRRSTKP